MAVLRLITSSYLVGACTGRCLLALEDAIDVACRAPILIDLIERICDQPTALDMEAKTVDRWEPIASGKRYDQVAVNVSHWGGRHDKSAPRFTGKRCYSAFNFAGPAPSINRTYFNTQRYCRRLDCNKLADPAGIT